MREAVAMGVIFSVLAVASLATAPPLAIVVVSAVLIVAALVVGLTG
jgi:hypothetical protein